MIVIFSNISNFYFYYEVLKVWIYRLVTLSNLRKLNYILYMKTINLPYFKYNNFECNM